MTLFSTGLADPPWPEKGGGKVKRGADRHYPVMSVDDICALRVGELFAPDAHLYLWVTNNFLPAGLRVMAAWGFRYVTNLVWGKVKDGRVQQGLGQYFRGSHELLLFGVRGSVPYRTLDDGKRAQGSTLLLAPRSKHSRKPEGFRQLIERVSPGPYLELFAREPASGWAVWGNEVASDVAVAAEGTLPLFGELA